MTPALPPTPASPAGAPGAGEERDAGYLRLLAVLLGTVTFFEGYDTGIAAIIIPDLARDFHASTATIGRVASMVNLGALVALVVIALGDRVGRRPLLVGTTLLYAVLTGLTAAAPGLLAFAAIQFFARMFLVSDLAIAITIATEEFPADRRGRLLGVLSALGGAGLVTVAALYHVVAGTALGWRALYLVGTVPLLAVVPLRLKLRESRRWLEAKAAGTSLRRASVWGLVTGAYGRRLALVCGVLFLYNFATISGSAYWTLFVRRERGFSGGTATTFLALAVVAGIPGYLAAGRLQDRWGRRRTGAVFLLVGMAAGIAAFQVRGRGPLLVSLWLAVFFGLGATSVMNAVSSELFPTRVRATCVAIARSIFGTLGASAGLLIVGALAARNGLIGTVGNSVTLAALALVPAILLLLALPETGGKELEDLAAVGGPPG